MGTYYNKLRCISDDEPSVSIEKLSVEGAFYNERKIGKKGVAAWYACGGTKMQA